jgi:hypothetical protein
LRLEFPSRLRLNPNMKLTSEMIEILGTLQQDTRRAQARANCYLEQCAKLLGIEDTTKIVFDAQKLSFEPKPESTDSKQ